jgi:hypothetical protein
MAEAVTTLKKSLRNTAINAKLAEYQYLCSQMHETTWGPTFDRIAKEVHTSLREMTGMVVAGGNLGTPAEPPSNMDIDSGTSTPVNAADPSGDGQDTSLGGGATLPDGSRTGGAWIAPGYDVFRYHCRQWGYRAVTIAQYSVDAQIARKLSKLELQKKTKSNLETRAAGQSITKDLAQAVRDEVLRQNKIVTKRKNSDSSSGMADAEKRTRSVGPNTDSHREKFCAEREIQPASFSEPSPETEGQGRQKRQRKERQVNQEVELVRRQMPTTGPRRKAGDFPDLYLNLSEPALRRFHYLFTPLHQLEALVLKHDFGSGVFKHRDVSLPRDIEYKLALNSKFILHKAPDVSKVDSAWEKLSANVAWRYLFRHGSDYQKDYIPRFYTPTGREPNWDEIPQHITKGLKAGKETLLRQISLLNQPGHMSNPDMRQVKEFCESSQLLVKLTDKNLGLAVVPVDWYEGMCETLLLDRQTYFLCSKPPPVHLIVSMVEKVLNEHLDMRPTLREYIMKDIKTVTPNFHGLPKVHKKIWNIRPIVPSHSWCTSRCSEVADFALRPLLKLYPWVVDSTREVVSLMDRKPIIRGEDVWLITGDVEAFYTNVSLDTLYSDVAELLESHPECNVGVSPNALASLLEVVMENNFFEYDGKFYRQVNGLAMGTSCAPAVANLHLALMEDKLIRPVPEAKEGLIFYVRYIDDIFAVYKGSKEAVNQFFHNLKFGAFTIDWKVTPSYTSQSFLDLNIWHDQGPGNMFLNTSLFRKSMNKHMYIPWSSAHPLPVKKSFVKAEMTRFSILASHKTYFIEAVSHFMDNLRVRGYPDKILHSWGRQVEYESRWHYLREVPRRRTTGIPLLLPSTYDKIWEYVSSKEVFGAMLDKWVEGGEVPDSLSGPLIKSLSRTENLFDMVSAWNKTVLREYRDPT